MDETNTARTATVRTRDYEGIHLLRALACVMVVFIHASDILFYKFSPKWTAGIFFDSFSRVCIPLFLMIAGYLSLDKQEDILHYYKKRFVRIILPFIFYSLIYTYFNHKFIFTFLEKPIAVHLWYVYYFIGVSLFIPFMASTASRLTAPWVSSTVWGTPRRLRLTLLE